MVWIPDSHIDLISDDTKAIALLATIMLDGSPQLTPIWFNTDGKHILINSARGRVKDRNMRREPHVAITIMDPQDDYRYIQIRGRVIDLSTDGAREHINVLSKKYTGKDKFTPNSEDEVRVTYKILPEFITAG